MVPLQSGTVHTPPLPLPPQAVKVQVEEAQYDVPGRSMRMALQVTNTGERTIELRALMSAADASTVWNLRCEVREKLLAFIRENHPDYLPRVRAELERAVKR